MYHIELMDEKELGGSSPSLGGEEVNDVNFPQEAIYHSKDVFGEEEDHEIKYKVTSLQNYRYYILCLEKKNWRALIMRLRYLDTIVGACRCSHDSRDCQQWHALSAIVACCGRSCAWYHSDCFPGLFWAVHKLDPDPIQVETSRRWVQCSIGCA